MNPFFNVAETLHIAVWDQTASSNDFAGPFQARQVCTLLFVIDTNTFGYMRTVYIVKNVSVQ